MSAFLSEQKLKNKKDGVCLRNKDDKNQKVLGMGPWAINMSLTNIALIMHGFGIRKNKTEVNSSSYNL